MFWWYEVRDGGPDSGKDNVGDAERAFTLNPFRQARGHASQGMLNQGELLDPRPTDFYLA